MEEPDTAQLRQRQPRPKEQSKKCNYCDYIVHVPTEGYKQIAEEYPVKQTKHQRSQNPDKRNRNHGHQLSQQSQEQFQQSERNANIPSVVNNSNSSNNIFSLRSLSLKRPCMVILILELLDAISTSTE